MKNVRGKGKALLATCLVAASSVSMAATTTPDAGATAMVTAVKTSVEANQSILWGIGAVVIVVSAIGMLIRKASSRAS